MLTVDECREMSKTAGLEEKVMAKTWLLGLRTGDCCKLEWQRFNLKPEKVLTIGFRLFLEWDQTCVNSRLFLVGFGSL